MKKVLWLVMFALVTSFVWASQSEPEMPAAQRMKPALLVIDIQNAYLPLMAEEDKGIAMYMINASIRLFRSHGFPVIRVYHTDPEYGPQPGTEPFEFPSTVQVKPEDSKIVKNYPSSFKKTELEKLLREKGCNTVFLCGLSAVGCVLATYFRASDLDFNVFMIKDALISHKATYTNYVEEICSTVDLTALELMLQNSEK